MGKLRLFWQIFPLCVGISFISLLITGWLIHSTARAFYLDQLKKEIKERALLIQESISDMSKEDDQSLQDFVRQRGRKAATRITVIDADGRVLADSNEDHALMDNHAKRPEVAAALSGSEGYDLRRSKTLRESMLYAAIPVELTAEGHKGALRLAISAASFDTIIGLLGRKLFFICLAVLALAALLSLYSARRISRPLEQIKRGALELATERFDQPIRIDSDNMSVEMAGLANCLNQMATQIKHRVGIIIQQRNELEAVFSSMADAVAAIDADKKIIRMNQAATRIFALHQENVQGKPAEGVIRNDQLLALIDFTLEHNTQQEQQLTLFSGAEEGKLLVQTHAVPLRDEHNQSIGVLLVMNDLTKLNRLEHIRQDFVANVSHELKTPITLIKGYIETLLDGALHDGDHAKRFLEIAVAQANRLDAIVEDLLTLSRIEGGNSEEDLAVEFSGAAPILQRAIEACASLAEEKNIFVQLDCDPSLLAPMNAPLMEQAMINLLKNALTYSPMGSTVLVRCAHSRNRQGEHYLHFSVSDSGLGIAKEHLPRIFERFYRCDKARSRNMGGTGLGLAIVKHIAQAHKGGVEVESIPGRGATFIITLPMNSEAGAS